MSIISSIINVKKSYCLMCFSVSFSWVVKTVIISNNCFIDTSSWFFNSSTWFFRAFPVFGYFITLILTLSIHIIYLHSTVFTTKSMHTLLLVFKLKKSGGPFTKNLIIDQHTKKNFFLLIPSLLICCFL